MHKCLDALSRQTVIPQKVIVVDNSADFLEKENACCNFKVETISPGENIGFAAANNLGVRRARDSEWIALLNPDAFPEPMWLEGLLKAATKYPEYDFFGSKLIRYYEPAVLDGIEDIYHTSGLVWRHKHGCRFEETDMAPREIFSACAAAALYRKSAFLEAGGFDERYFCYLEDVDLGFRLRLLGYRCLYVPKAVAYHIGSASTGNHSDFMVYHGHRNLVWTYLKNMPRTLLLFYLPQHLILNIFSLIWFSLKGRGKIIFKAKKDAMVHFADILQDRRVIQKKRRVSLFEIRKLMVKGAYAVLKRPE